MDRKMWGHIFESGIGAYLICQAFIHRFEVYYWRERNDEVDFILRKKGSIVAIEIKSNAEKKTDGLDKFRQRFKPQSSFIVGDGGALRPKIFCQWTSTSCFRYYAFQFLDVPST